MRDDAAGQSDSTRYRYSQAQVSGSRHGLRVSFKVTNTGRRAGSEVAQVYAGLPAKAGEPPKRLVGWARLDLRPGETRRATVEIEPERLAVWDADADRWDVVGGHYDILVGASSRDIRLKGGTLIRGGY